MPQTERPDTSEETLSALFLASRDRRATEERRRQLLRQEITKAAAVYLQPIERALTVIREQSSEPEQGNPSRRVTTEPTLELSLSFWNSLTLKLEFSRSRIGTLDLSNIAFLSSSHSTIGQQIGSLPMEAIIPAVARWMVETAGGNEGFRIATKPKPAFPEE